MYDSQFEHERPVRAHVILSMTLLLVYSSSAISGPSSSELINLNDGESIRARRPIVVAHRGGVVSEISPECSVTAIRLAAVQGYDMVELDIQMSRDGVPIVFHDRRLIQACGRDEQVADLTADELETIPYLRGSDHVARLDTALKTCQQLGLGVMLDLKAGQDLPEFLASIDRLVVSHGLGNACISITGSDDARRVLKHCRFTPTDVELRRLRLGESVDLSRRFWFGLPNRLEPGDIGRLQAAGALVIPAINTFRYPAESHLQLARDDIRRLRNEGVDGFQIDSIYFSFLATE